MPEQKPLIDLEFGLSQLGGNAELLDRMLGKFKDQFQDIPSLVTQQLRDGDYESAKLRIHTAKGITGNLGLSALFDCCKLFDAQLKQKQADPDTVLQFEELMRDTCLEIDRLKSGAMPEQSLNEHKHIEDAKPQLVALLSRHEFIDDSLLRDLVESIAMKPEEADLLIDMVEQLQYEKAISMLTK